jgi:hypothetical protein
LAPSAANICAIDLPRPLLAPVTTIEVEADDEENARTLAKQQVDHADWEPGDDAESVRCYAVLDKDGVVVWEDL